jgi:uncharacterized membrane protein
VIKINRDGILFVTTYSWAVFVLLSWRQSNPIGLLNIVGYLCLLFIPGLLTQFSIGLGSSLPFWHRLGQILGVSILELFIWTLLCNTLLPHLHIARPLDRHPMLIELSVLYVGLAIWTYVKLGRFKYRLKWDQLFGTRNDLFIIIAPLMLVILSIAGAISLNNGGTDLITLVMLIGCSLLIIYLLFNRDKIKENSFAWAIYLMSVSLLFMTSLRGWYVTGHDIQHEFQVFQLTKHAGLWAMAHQRDPYNACLSITILPTIFANTLHLNDPYVYKVLFQLIFGSVPVMIFLLMRRYLSKAKSLLAVVYFIAFPTFFTDMAFLNRQEIAFLFLSLMLLVIFDERIKLRKKQWLFICFGLGMILSHYSTTYSVLLLLFFMICARPIYNWIAPRLSSWKMFRNSSINVLDRTRKKISIIITIPMVIMLIYFCFIWYGVITNTASGATNIIAQTIESVKNGLNTDSRSSDVSYSIFSPGAASPGQQLKEYVKDIVSPERAKFPDEFYPTSIIEQTKTNIVTEPSLPVTGVGHTIAKLGVNISALNNLLKQTYAKLLQVFVALGLIYMLCKKKFNNSLEPEFFLLSLASIVFVLLQVILPDLSQAYGLLRAFQQSLMVLGLLLVVGTFALASGFRNRLILYALPSLIAIGFFLSSTGVISQILGGYQAQLFLNNSGQYYDVYYTHKQELAGIDWLNNITQETKYGVNTHALMQTDEFTSAKLAGYTSLPTVADVYPGVIQKDSYVFLGYTNVTKNQAGIFYNGDLITYTYPTKLLNQEKNLIYSNGGTEIYK